MKTEEEIRKEVAEIEKALFTLLANKKTLYKSEVLQELFAMYESRLKTLLWVLNEVKP